MMETITFTAEKFNQFLNYIGQLNLPVVQGVALHQQVQILVASKVERVPEPPPE